MRHVWKQSKQHGSALVVMLAIADQANDDGDCWPGVRKLAGKCRLSERGLQKILAALQTAGELQVFLNEGTKTKTGFTNRYRVLGVNTGTPLEPEGVNPSSPVEVNTSSPPDSEGVNAGTPPGVNASSPDPKEEPKENTEPTKAIAPTSPNSGESSAGETGNPVQDIPEPPKPKPKRARKSNADPVPSTLMTPMKNAIAAAFGWSWDGDTPMSEEEVGIIQKAARSLCKAKYTPEGIPALYAFCQRKYDTFGPMALATNVSKFRQSGGKHNGLGSQRPAPGRSGVTGPAGGAPPPVIPEERKRFIAEQNERRRKELAAKGFKVPGYTPGTA